MDPIFLNRMKMILKDDYDSFVESLSKPSLKAFYINDNKKNVLNYLNHDYIVQHPIVHNGYYFDYHHYPLGKSPFFLCGLYYIQEPSAMLVANSLDIKEDDYILDMCAAPGGKTCAIAAKLSNKGLMIANDINPLRAKILSENVERFGLQNTIVTNTDPLMFTKQLPGFFDKIILDAPCSGEGMFRKEDQAIDTWSMDKVKESAYIQKQLIEAAYHLLAPNGEIIYSTCTYSKEENEDIIQYALDHFDLSLVPIPKSHGMSEGLSLKEVVRLYPHRYDGEGHFIALLKKGNDDKRKTKVPLLKSNINKDKQKIVQDFYKENLNIKVPPYLYENNNHIYAILPQFPKLEKIKILRTGLYLGECKKNYFLPSYSLALTLNKEDVKRSYRFKEDSSEIKKYIHGETLEGHKEKGYGVIFVEEYPLSFYKESNHQIKNLFPKGLRR